MSVQTIIKNIRLNKLERSFNMKNFNKNGQEKGITLIALVVTIIVLLILARNKHSNAYTEEMEY